MIEDGLPVVSTSVRCVGPGRVQPSPVERDTHLPFSKWASAGFEIRLGLICASAMAHGIFPIGWVVGASGCTGSGEVGDCYIAVAATLTVSLGPRGSNGGREAQMLGLALPDFC